MKWPRRCEARRAAALPMVLMSLGLVGALVVGGAFATRRAVDDARNDNRSLALRPAAERAIVLALAGLDSATLAQAPGTTIVGPQFVTPETVTSTWFTVLVGGSIWVVGDASTRRKPLLYNRLALICRPLVPDMSGCRAAAWLELP